MTRVNKNLDQDQNAGVTAESTVSDTENKNIFKSFKQHEASLRRYISSFFITRQDIDDISQETFLRSFESNIKGNVQQPKSFMYRVAKNLILSEYRRSSYKLTDYIEDMEEVDAPLDITDLENDVEAQQTLGLFCEGLASLPEQCRRVLVMRKVYGLSIKEISKRLDMPTSTINWNIAKGMTHCDNLIEEHEKNGTAFSQSGSGEKNLNGRVAEIGRIDK